MAALGASTAIFSPSVARIAASTAKDWNYIDRWLSSKFHGRTPPAFEHNVETLRALLALAMLNEAADEERDLMAQVEAEALEVANSSGQGADKVPHRSIASGMKGTILQGVEDQLTSDGQACLDAMAASSVQSGDVLPEPGALGRTLAQLQRTANELDQMRSRLLVLHDLISCETSHVGALSMHFQSDAYRPPSNLAKQNLEVQRKLKAASSRLPDLRDRVAALASPLGNSQPTIEQIAHQEQEYLSLLGRKRELDEQLRRFAGLPNTTDLARTQLEERRRELRDVSSRRDEVFEGLVERDSPRKE